MSAAFRHAYIIITASPGAVAVPDSTRESGIVARRFSKPGRQFGAPSICINSN